VLELERCDRSISGTGQDGKGNQRAVAALDLCGGGHHLDDVPDLVQSWHGASRWALAILVSLTDR
jgi:hypothetical protein